MEGLIKKRQKKETDEETIELLKAEPKVTEIITEDNNRRIIAILKDFIPETPEVEGKKYPIGDYAIINTKERGSRTTTTKFIITNIVPNLHSHIKTNGGRDCYGNITSQARTARETGDRYTAIKTAIMLLDQYNYHKGTEKDSYKRYLNQARIHARIRGRKEKEEEIRETMRRVGVREMDEEDIRKNKDTYGDETI